MKWLVRVLSRALRRVVGSILGGGGRSSKYEEDTEDIYRLY